MTEAADPKVGGNGPASPGGVLLARTTMSALSLPSVPAEARGEVRERLLRGERVTRKIAEGIITRHQDQQRTAKSRRKIAIHEAGHAVMAIRLGARVLHMELSPEGHGGTLDNRSYDHTGDYLLARAAVCFAGRAAEYLLGVGPREWHDFATSIVEGCGTPAHDTWMRNLSLSMTDIHEAAVCAMNANPEARRAGDYHTIGAWLRDANDLADVALAVQWSRVLILAGTLMQHGTLQEAQIQRALQ
jgi:hypothetical protein